MDLVGLFKNSQEYQIQFVLKFSKTSFEAAFFKLFGVNCSKKCTSRQTVTLRRADRRRFKN